MFLYSVFRKNMVFSIRMLKYYTFNILMEKTICFLYVYIYKFNIKKVQSSQINLQKNFFVNSLNKIKLFIN